MYDNKNKLKRIIDKTVFDNLLGLANSAIDLTRTFDKLIKLINNS